MLTIDYVLERLYLAEINVKEARQMIQFIVDREVSRAQLEAVGDFARHHLAIKEGK